MWKFLVSTKRTTCMAALKATWFLLSNSFSISSGTLIPPSMLASACCKQLPPKNKIAIKDFCLHTLKFILNNCFSFFMDVASLYDFADGRETTTIQPILDCCNNLFLSGPLAVAQAICFSRRLLLLLSLADFCCHLRTLSPPLWSIKHVS